VPFYATLGFVAAAFAGYIAYRIVLVAVNEKKVRWLEGRSAGEVEDERLSEERYADGKMGFVYGL
jgi:hypothetical protein